MRKQQTVGFVGAGNMAGAMIRGLVKSGVPGSRVLSFDVDRNKLQTLQKAYRIRAAKSNGELFRSCDVAVLAVKPQVMEPVLREIGPLAKKSPLVLSIAAGIPISLIAGYLGPDARIVRAMPNTPALIGKGVSGFYAGPKVRPAEKALAREILSALGPALEFANESLLDAVTGLSGSGPAYVYLVIEALADGGVKMGLTREAALTLAARTVAGAAAMVLETGEHPAKLKDMVTSPGGTTIAGLAVLERARVRSALIEAVEKATLRAQELGKPRG
ncbi:MAG: pyrroline-5-carboxylate reductase [Deltaproteobacteria bacterium RBG_13_61_14]|nr:MAG: pyrroline-5-carboxylate reductase [Deltaproteobacteria bacterium RBG_13_61_14]